MLIIPIMESFADKTTPSWEVISNSIRDVIFTAAEQRRNFKVLRSVDIIAAFHQRYCNIPPFCERGTP